MNKDFRDTIIFLLPLLLLVSLFMLIPVLGTFWLSLWQDVAFLTRKFVGLANYLRLLKDTQFWQSVGFTLIFSLISVAVEMVLGIIVALVVSERFRGRGAIRGVSLLPWAIPAIIGARIWQLIYRYDYGLANYLLGSLFGVSVNWLGSSAGAMFSLIVADVWRTTPFVAIIILAGLQSVPEELYKQARVDGANLFQRFTKVIMPTIKPVVVVALLFRTIDALRVFDIIYVITGGGPGGATTSLSLYSYKYFLLGDFGYGSTISFVLFVIAFGLALLYINLGKFREIAL